MILNNIIINISENVSGKQDQCINIELIFYFISYFKMLWPLRKFAQQESRALFTAGWGENSIFHRMPGIWISSAASQLDYENHFSWRTKKKRDSYRAKLAKLDNRRHMIFSGWKKLFCSPYWICFLNVHLLTWGCGYLVNRAMMKIVLLIWAEKNNFYLSLIVIAQKNGSFLSSQLPLHFIF